MFSGILKFHSVLKPLQKYLRFGKVWSAGAKGFLFCMLVSSSFSLYSEQLDLSKIGVSNELSDGKKNRSGLTVEQAAKQLQADTDRIKSEIRAQLCDDAQVQNPCSVLPMDNTDFSEFFVYVFLTESGQNSFDVFSWQSFIALNWPADSAPGESLTALNAPNDVPRRWYSYKTRQELLNDNPKLNACSGIKQSPAGENAIVVSSNYLQTSGKPLIDRLGNYVVYDVRVNQEMSDYILSNGLESEQGQATFFGAGKTIDFPKGQYSDVVARTGGEEGSIALKTAWRILQDDTAMNDSYFTVDGLVPVDSSISATGEAFCLEVALGMVGMHIMRRTDSGNGDKWIWSTFEHVDNAPLAKNYRRPNDVLHEQPFENGCSAPDSVDRSYTFYSDDCEHCPTNSQVGKNWLWSPEFPHAVDSDRVAHTPTQVVRCWEIFEGTQLVNNIWREHLADTVWANYESTSAQWVGSKPNHVVPNGEVPKFMSNTTMETYEQDKLTGSCIGCHAAARTATGHESNELFLLSLKSRF